MKVDSHTGESQPSLTRHLNSSVHKQKGKSDFRSSCHVCLDESQHNLVLDTRPFSGLDRIVVDSIYALAKAVIRLTMVTAVYKAHE